MRGVFATHFYSIASGDYVMCQVRDLMHNIAKSVDFAKQYSNITSAFHPLSG